MSYQAPYGQSAPAPQPNYGQQPPMAPGYGQQQPPAQQQMPPTEIKWGGLAKGAQKIPVIEFIGRLVDMQLDTANQNGVYINESYDQVQILESPAPWPWATVGPIGIKYSDREESGWGRHVSSAKELGLAVNAMTFDQAKADLIGKTFRMRQADENYGTDQKTGQTFHGNVWRFKQVVGQGGSTGYQPPPQTPVPMPQPNFPQPPYAPPVNQQQVPQPPVYQQPYVPPTNPQVPAPQQQQQAPAPAGFNAMPLPTDTAAVRAKKLLHGRALNEFLAVALVDPIIKADPAFVNSIFDQSFIVGLKAQNQVSLGADQKFTVIA